MTHFERLTTAALLIGSASGACARPTSVPAPGPSPQPVLPVESTGWSAAWYPGHWQQWSLLYREFRTEFLGCLYGAWRGDTIAVEVFLLADVKPSHSTTRGVGGSCLPERGFFGTLHNHPADGGCAFSRRDLESFAWFIKYRGAVLDVLICRETVGLIHWRHRLGKQLDRCVWDPERVWLDMRFLQCETLTLPTLPEVR